jgi:hypothetical protein
MRGEKKKKKDRKKKRWSALHQTSPNSTRYLKKKRHDQDDLNDISENPF